MKKSTLIASAAVVGLMTSAATPVLAQTGMEKVKCYGIAKAGHNDCGSADGSHSCAGHATTDYDPNEWKLASKDECDEMGGGLTPEEAAANEGEAGEAMMMKGDVEAHGEGDHEHDEDGMGHQDHHSGDEE